MSGWTDGTYRRKDELTNRQTDRHLSKGEEEKLHWVKKEKKFEATNFKRAFERSKKILFLFSHYFFRHYVILPTRHLVNLPLGLALSETIYL
jgi:hypothetical protein